MRVLAVLIYSAFAAGAAHAQLYKWVDENGRPQYTQTPPPPGRSGQQVKIQPPPPAKSAQPGATPDQKGKAAPSQGSGGDAADAKRLSGTWRTAPDARVQADIQVRGRGGGVVEIVQQWLAGSASIVGSGKYVVAGEKGTGTLKSQDSSANPNPDAALPASIRYQLLKDGWLILTVSSGRYEGEHHLRR